MELFFGDGIFCGKVLDKPCPVCYNSARRMCSDEKNMRVWRNWQTRMIQVHIEAIRWRFKSSYPHHIGTPVLIRYLRSFSFTQKPLGTKGFDTFANEINFIVLELTTRKSKLSDANLCIFAPNQITMTLYSKKISVIVKKSVMVLFIGQMICYNINKSGKVK